MRRAGFRIDMTLITAGDQWMQMMMGGAFTLMTYTTRLRDAEMAFF